jgi:hypothetical protein
MYDAYRRLASKLGLRLSDDPGVMTFRFDLSGDLDGQRVRLERVCGRGAHIVVSAPLAAHLDLGLGLGRAGFVSRVAEWLGTRDIQVGEPAFDAAFTLRGDEPDRVRALLCTELRVALASLIAPSFELNDAGFTAHHDVQDESVTTLERALREAVSVVRAVEAARSLVPPAAFLRHHAELWHAFARERAFGLSTTPLGMHGFVGQTAIEARAWRKSADDFMLEVRARLEAPLPVHLEVEPQRDVVAAALGKRSLATGDASFDAAFDVTVASRPEVLDAEVRRRMLELRALGSVSLSGAEVTFVTDLSRVEPAHLPLLIEDLCALLGTLEQSASGPGVAYR